MAHFGYVNSSDPDAPLPKVGTRWVWEIDSAAARALVEVAEVKWNGEEWWVGTVALMPDSYPSSGRPVEWNEIGRFWEAVTVVGGAVTGLLMERRPQDAHEIIPE